MSVAAWAVVGPGFFTGGGEGMSKVLRPTCRVRQWIRHILQVLRTVGRPGPF